MYIWTIPATKPKNDVLSLQAAKKIDDDDKNRDTTREHTDFNSRPINCYMAFDSEWNWCEELRQQRLRYIKTDERFREIVDRAVARVVIRYFVSQATIESFLLGRAQRRGLL